MNLKVRYDSAKQQFLIHVPSREVIPAIRDWPGWRRHPSGTYMAPAWPSSVLVMSKTIHTLQWDEFAARMRDRLLYHFNCSRKCLEPGAKLDKDVLPWPTERQPKPHQRQAIHSLRFMEHRALLADDMGLGKTSTALWAAYDVDVKRLLVICPVSVKFNWQNEINATLGDLSKKEDGWATWVIDGTSKQRAQQLVEVGMPRYRVAIIINYDLLEHLSEQQFEQLKVFAAQGMLLLDESHYLKNRNSKRTELVMQLRAPYVIAMTGTPIRNLAEDLFSQVELVRPGTWSSFNDFAKRYLVIRPMQVGKRQTMRTVGTRNLDELNAVVNTLQIRRKKSEVLDLPEKTFTYPELTLEGELGRVYKAMKDFARVELNKLVDAQKSMNVFDPRARSGVEQAMRCEQIAQGFIGGIPEPLMQQLAPSLTKIAENVPGRPRELMFPSHPKVVWMLETIETILKQGGAPLVGCRFNAPLVWMHSYQSRLGVKSGLLHGELSPTQKHDVVHRFQNKELDVLLVQVKIAEGWNAQRSQDVIHWTRDWSPAVNTQFEDRAHRMGQIGTVNVQVPIVRNTVEMRIHKRLMAKDADAEQALRNMTIEELMEAL